MTTWLLLGGAAIGLVAYIWLLVYVIFPFLGAGRHAPDREDDK